jgi:autotransporter-associated beta strand protein
MVVAQKLAFDGSTPYDLTVPAHTGVRDIPYLTLGFTLSSEKGDEPVKPAWPHLTNLWTVVDFDVTDITKDSETDATIRLPIRNMVNMSYTDYNNTAINGYTYNPWQWCHFQGGIRKTGPGTLCLNGAISYTHTTEVAGGALLVDSSLATSSGVTVDSGAWLGGTGTVSAVTVKDGGGFICYAGRNAAKVLRVPSLTAEGDVVVRVANPDGRDSTDFRQPVLQLTAKPAAVDFQNWRVSYEGEEDHWRSFSFRYDPGTGVVSAFYSGGTMVIFR